MNILLAPRIWLTAGAFCIGSSMVLGYHEDQLAASRALAQKVGLPDQVMIQDFRVETNSNLVDEVHVIGEISLRRATRANIGTEATPRWVQIIPIYPVSAEGLPLAEARLAMLHGHARRPMPREQAVELADARIESANATPAPLGLVIREGNTDDRTELVASDIASTVLGQGEFGPLVEIMGAQLYGMSLASSVGKVLAAVGIDSTAAPLMISPYSKGRESALATPDFSNLRSLLAAAASFFIACGLGAVLASFVPRTVKGQKQTTDNVAASGAFPSIRFFQPIATQAEIVNEIAKAAEDKKRQAWERKTGDYGFARWAALLRIRSQQ
jgi:hypothetical protein